MTYSIANIKNEPASFKLALKWLLFLGPFFLISYSFANWLASAQNTVSHIVFAWEASIPFVPWTVMPYWSIDVLYALSLFICSTKVELNSHGKRLLTAQIIAVTCFILYPMGFSFERPDTDGLFGFLLLILKTFDQPFNQAPSLHIALLIIIWVVFPRHLPRQLLWPFHLLCVAIGFSVLTTYQHHFIDVPTGALLGWFCVWLWPENGQSMLAKYTFKRDLFYTQRRYRLASYYMIGSLFLCFIAYTFNGWLLWLFWPAFSLLLVSLFYFIIGPKGFQKNKQGEMSLASQWLLLPYLIGAKLNAYIWTRKQASSQPIIKNLWLGGIACAWESDNLHYHTVIDMAAEMSISKLIQSKSRHWFAFSSLDLLPPSNEDLIAASGLIEKAIKENKTTLVCCALGYSRSVMTVIVYLVLYKHVNHIDDAITFLDRERYQFVLKNSDYQYLSLLLAENKIS
jgi:hypothetical protein